jgi:hypothetical protein
MMRGFGNLPPTGGKREMFERKWLEWDSKGLAVGRELRIGGVQRDFCSLSPPASL